MSSPVAIGGGGVCTPIKVEVTFTTLEDDTPVSAPIGQSIPKARSVIMPMHQGGQTGIVRDDGSSANYVRGSAIRQLDDDNVEFFPGQEVGAVNSLTLQLYFLIFPMGTVRSLTHYLYEGQAGGTGYAWRTTNIPLTPPVDHTKSIPFPGALGSAGPPVRNWQNTALGQHEFYLDDSVGNDAVLRTYMSATFTMWYPFSVLEFR